MTTHKIIEVIDKKTGRSIYRGAEDYEAMGSPLRLEYIAVLMVIRAEEISGIATDGGKRWTVESLGKIWHIYKVELKNRGDHD